MDAVFVPSFGRGCLRGGIGAHTYAAFSRDTYRGVRGACLFSAFYLRQRQQPHIRAFRRSRGRGGCGGADFEPADEYTVFRNAVAAGLEIDFIIVGPTGVFAIEVKAYSGTLLGDYSEQQWLKRKRSHMGNVYEKDVPNPLLQARRGAAALSRELLRRGERIYVNGAVYLAGGECTAEITGDPPCERLFSHYDELLDFITENPHGISPRAEKNICGIIRDIAGL